MAVFLGFVAAQRDEGRCLRTAAWTPAGQIPVLVVQPLVTLGPGTAPARPCSDPKEFKTLVCSFLSRTGGSSSLRLVGTGPSPILAGDTK